MHFNSSKFSQRTVNKDALPSPVSYYNTQGVNLKGKGLWVSAICPFHDDTAPSFRINTEKGAFKCMACGASGGDIIAFQMLRYGQNFIEACKALGVWLGGNKK
jgi:DNA primase